MADDKPVLTGRDALEDIQAVVLRCLKGELEPLAAVGEISGLLDQVDDPPLAGDFEGCG